MFYSSCIVRHTHPHTHLNTVCVLLLVFLLQGEISKNVVFLISFWGDQIGQKVQKICDW